VTGPNHFSAKNIPTLPTGGRYIRNTTTGYELSGVHCKQVPFSKVLQKQRLLPYACCLLGEGEASRQEVLFRWTFPPCMGMLKALGCSIGPMFITPPAKSRYPEIFFLPHYEVLSETIVCRIFLPEYIEFEKIVTHMFCRKFYFQ
jgi:hypothetical protein